MQRWEIVRSIIDFPNSRKGGSLANIRNHIPDITNVDIWTLNQAICLELGGETASRYGARLHSAFRDDSTSSSFSKHATINALHIITVYRGSLLAQSIFYLEPKKIFLKLLQDYKIECVGSDNGNEDTWLISDIKYVLSVAAVSHQEERSMKACIEQLIEALPSNELVISMFMLVNALKLCPAALQRFRTQLLLAGCTDDQRLHLLACEEEKALKAFQRQSSKVIGKKRLEFFSKRFMCRVFIAWRLELDLAKRARMLQKRAAFEAWLLATKRIRLSHIFTNVSRVNYCKSRGRRSLRKLIKNARNAKKIKSCYTSEEEKDTRAGLGHVRIWLKKTTMRRALLSWVAFKDLEAKGELGAKWYKNKLSRRAFRQYHAYCQTQMKIRRAVRESSIQQSKILEHIKDMKTSTVSLKEDNSIPSTLVSKLKRARQYEEARKRQVEHQKQVDANILAQQRTQRRERVMSDQEQREHEFESIWSANKLIAETLSLESNKKLVLTSDFKNQCDKEVKQIQRHLSIQGASVSDTERESAITSSSAISYSILDAHLAYAGLIPEEFLHRLGQLPSPIRAVPFQAALISCELVLDAVEFLDIFKGLAQHTTTPRDSIELTDLQELRCLSNKYIGKEGSRWKMYVCPINKQQMLRNIVTGETFLQKKIKKKLMRQAVSENIQDHELLKARRKCYEDKQQAHIEMLQHYAAKSLQSMYYKFRGRQSMKKQQWALNRRKLFRLRTRQAMAVLLIQRRFRANRNR